MKRLLETGRHDQEQQFPERTENLPTAVTFRANEHTRLTAKAKLSDTSAGQHVENEHGGEITRVRNPFPEFHQTAWNSPQRKLALSSIPATFYMTKESNVNPPVVSRSVAVLLLISWNQINRPGPTTLWGGE